MEDDQKLRVRLVGRDGRRRYDPCSRDRLVAACLEPGVSVSRRNAGGQKPKLKSRRGSLALEQREVSFAECRQIT